MQHLLTLRCIMEREPRPFVYTGCRALACSLAHSRDFFLRAANLPRMRTNDSLFLLPRKFAFSDGVVKRTREYEGRFSRRSVQSAPASLRVLFIEPRAMNLSKLLETKSDQDENDIFERQKARYCAHRNTHARREYFSSFS